MKQLQLFLTALEELFSNKNIKFIVNKISNPSRFPAYISINIQLYEKYDNKEILISSIEKVGKTDSIENKIVLEDDICKETIKNVLKYYGI